MTASIIRRLSVPGAGESNEGIHAFMPKLNYRFRSACIFNPKINDQPSASPDKQRLITNAVISTDRPQLEHEEVEVPIGASRIWIPGRYAWAGPLEMELREDVGSRTMQTLEAQQRRQFDVINQSGARAGSEFKMYVITDTLNGDFDNVKVLDRWFLLGAFITKLGQSRVEYGTSAVQTISLGIRFDMAVHVQNGETVPDGVATEILPKDWGPVDNEYASTG